MAAKRKTKKKITLSEFKTWLAGVQSMQPDDWHPSKENWAMILEQIDNITETVVEKEVVIHAPAPELDRGPHPPQMTGFDPRNPAHAAMLEQNHSDSMLHAQHNLPIGTPSAPPAPPPRIGTPAGDNGAISLEINDSDNGGGYESSFAD